jgi:hypothetical protein
MCIHWLCTQVHVAVDPHAHGHVAMWSCSHIQAVSVSTCRLCATCKWTFIHMHGSVYLHACGRVSTCTWMCIYVHVAVYLHVVQPIVVKLFSQLPFNSPSVSVQISDSCRLAPRSVALQISNSCFQLSGGLPLSYTASGRSAAQPGTFQLPSQ